MTRARLGLFPCLGLRPWALGLFIALCVPGAAFTQEGNERVVRTAACPVKIPLHELLLDLRRDLGLRGLGLPVLSIPENRSGLRVLPLAPAAHEPGAQLCGVGGAGDGVLIRANVNPP